MPSTRSSWDSVPVVDSIDEADFYSEFVANRRPVIIRGLTTQWRALNWGTQRFRGVDSSVKFAVKIGNVAEGRRVQMSLPEYANALYRHEEQPSVSEDPGYLHDVPIFRFFPEFTREVDPFPVHLLPKWYRGNWQEYTQFFMGPTGSVTPLHFDTLLTHNLFFHLSGRKRFILIPADQRSLCYPSSWRWMAYDPTDPDHNAFPRARHLTAVTVELDPGDVLYMPSGTLHHVTNLSPSVSFNIDWHTADSARDGVLSVARGAPWKNGYYNMLSLLGVGLGLPAKAIFPLYRSYLNYVS